MTKYYGNIGFVKFVEEDPGKWVEEPVERKYKGDVVKNYRRWDKTSDGINGNLNINNTISIIADSYILQNSHYIRYAEFMGAYWEITSIEIDRPRLILELGGVYHKQEKPELPEESETPTGPDSENDFGER